MKMINDNLDLTDEVYLKELKDKLNSGKLGIEKESLRVFESSISGSLHPKELGSALCNYYINTDFSEAQLELVTPPLISKEMELDFLENIHHFVSKKINNEIIWPFSMPPSISSEEDIPIAYYGTSNLGLFKRIYRNGLSYRYGKIMQTISGIHYNYSLPDKIWYSSLFQNNNLSDKRTIRNKGYFRILRNVYRMNWLILYLFGASPVLTKNLITKDFSSFKKIDQNSYYLPYATSLRMSDYGYQNSIRMSNVSPNTLNEYISSLTKATNTISKQYQKIDNQEEKYKFQLNPNLLQIEDEYYAIARVKSQLRSEKRPTSKLKEGGVDYIELRSLDLNPFNRVGIDLDTIYFLEIFLIFCFLKPSQRISKDELEEIAHNDLIVAKYGRDPKIILNNLKSKISLKALGSQILEEMLLVAETLDNNKVSYTKIIAKMKSRIDYPETTLSALLIEKILKEGTSFVELGKAIGKNNKEYYLKKNKTDNPNWQLLNKEVKESLDKQNNLEKDDDNNLEGFIKNYFND